MKRSNIVRDLVGICVLIAVACGSGLLLNFLRGNPLPLIYASPQERLDAQLRNLIEAPPFRATAADTIDLGEFRSLVEHHHALVLDAREAPYYQRGHVPGALNLSRENFTRDYERLRPILEAARNKPIVVYCSGGDCHDSKMVTGALLSLGFSDARYFPGGWAAWTAAKLPIAR